MAGDWNTDLTVGTGLTRHPYGPAERAAQLLEAASDLGLRIVTNREPDPGPERDWMIDHVALPSNWSARVRPQSVPVDTDHSLILVEVD